MVSPTHAPVDTLTSTLASAANSPVATRTPASTPSPVDMVSPTHAPVDTLTSTLASTATPTVASYPSYPWSSPHATSTPLPPDVVINHTPYYWPCGGNTYSLPNTYFMSKRWWRHHFLQWTPSGSHILFDSETLLLEYGPETKLYAVRSDGSRLSELLELSHEVLPSIRASVDLRTQYLSAYQLGQWAYFDISPDGSDIVYSTCSYTSEPLNPKALGGVNEKLEEHNYEIVVSNSDGSGVQRLTENWRNDNYPVWSPDGTRIAFISASINHWEYPPYRSLRTMAPDGSDLRIISTSNRVIASYPPAWSPDGKRIAFVVEERPYNSSLALTSPENISIYVVGADGANLMRVSDTISPPSWSPDGSRIVFAGPYNDGAAIFTIGYDGTGLNMVMEITEDLTTRRESYPYPTQFKDPYSDSFVSREDSPFVIDRVLWSPDGSGIAFSCATVCVVDLDTSTLVRSPVQLPGWSIPAWSPDGSRLAVRNSGNPYPLGAIERIQLYTMSPDGTDVRVLVRGGNWSMVAENSGWRDLDASIDACDDGYVVPEPERNPGLVLDCTTLVMMRDTLAGTVPVNDLATGEEVPWTPILNWHGGTPIDKWVGVTVGGTPPRVIAIELLGSEVYRGWDTIETGRAFLIGTLSTLSTELGSLTELQTLNLDGNYLWGSILKDEAE